jgi:K+/H+ antiporter YhaU regulatory subunit KhtT
MVTELDSCPGNYYLWTNCGCDSEKKSQLLKKNPCHKLWSEIGLEVVAILHEQSFMYSPEMLIVMELYDIILAS